ncbi:FecR family protein [Plebeiibacterium sediminum]|uniref:FecR domain-containing protein n=1 Tax=Plebeiibacterium sediminum TaxID=2992112 RepID=A0AAE3M3J8_9BACT|nr:FecR family protein [Plebeiobacterium sediminum]MCW3786424.1 FecR domain-containing protein [Plebeiobacterium sediminum]
MKDPLSINELAHKKLNGTISEEENRLLEEWYQSEASNSDADWTREIPEEKLQKEMFDKIMQRVDSYESAKSRKTKAKHIIRRFTEVAAILIFVVGGYWIYTERQKAESIAQVEQKQDILPGTEDAILRIGNNKEINLSKVSDGRIVDNGKTSVDKKSGLLSYAAANSSVNDMVEIHEIITKRGNQYHLELSDGTKVWMNSASSLKFPERFNSDKRIVELEGEAYFEVAHNASKPFLVKVDGTVVRVLGTHFNISAYKDEKEIKTTLLEGSVQVSKDENDVIIKPGEQAIVQNFKKEPIQVNQADLACTMAWKDGFFEFDGVQLPVILRQLSRWYDVDFELKEFSTKETYGGRISKNLKLSKVLELLEINNVSFESNGDNFIVRIKE